jgi:Inner membrane protein YgaP-like, transmembrane domain
MTNNVGMIDRAARIIVGLLLLAYAIPVGFAPSNWNWIGWIGVIPLVTGLFGTCPLYSLLGLSTCPLRRTTS